MCRLLYWPPTRSLRFFFLIQTCVVLAQYKYVSPDIFGPFHLLTLLFFNPRQPTNEMMLMMTANKRKCPQENVCVCKKERRSKQRHTHKLIGNVALLYPLKYTKVSDVIRSHPLPHSVVATTGVTTPHTAAQKNESEPKEKNQMSSEITLSSSFCSLWYITYSLCLGEMCWRPNNPRQHKRREDKKANRKRCC